MHCALLNTKDSKGTLSYHYSDLQLSAAALARKVACHACIVPGDRQGRWDA